MKKNLDWNNQISKGMFELAILILVDKKPMYGYEITKELREGNVVQIANGSIYPILRRLSKNGWVDFFQEEHDGRSRKYYFTTNEGKEVKMGEIFTIERYLQQLNINLGALPLNEREEHLNEIRDDLLSIKEEMMIEYKCTDHEGEIKAIKSFIPVKELSEQILKQYEKEEDVSFYPKDFGFNASLGTMLASLAVFSFPIYHGGISAQLAGVLTAHLLALIITVYFTYFYYPKRWNDNRVKAIKTSVIFFIWILAFPFGAFALHIEKHNGITMFSTLYLFGYLLVWCVLYYSMRRQYKNYFKKIHITMEH